MDIQALLGKLQALPPSKIKEVEDFVDFLQHKQANPSLTRSMAEISAKPFAEVWENDEDAAYDRL